MTARLGKNQIKDLLYFLSEWNSYTLNFLENGACEGEYWQKGIYKDKMKAYKLERKLKEILEKKG